MALASRFSMKWMLARGERYAETHSASSSIALSQSATAPAKSSTRIRTDAREAYDSA